MPRWSFPLPGRRFVRWRRAGIGSIEGDAVAADARARIEGLEAIGLGLCRFDDLPDVDAHLSGEEGELVDEGDVDEAVGVLEDLHHLRGAGRGDRVEVLDRSGSA